MSMHVPVENHTCLTVDLARRVYTYVDLCTSTVESTGKPMGKQKTAAAGGAREYGQSESDRRPSPPVLFDFGSFLFSINRGHEQQQW